MIFKYRLIGFSFLVYPSIYISQFEIFLIGLVTFFSIRLPTIYIHNLKLLSSRFFSTKKQPNNVSNQSIFLY